ncbi:MAG: hypothetical protein JNJ64_00515 [Flavobacteriales bacterium]|nr:hypothetical protein [Flavobacteriales bacterium]
MRRPLPLALLSWLLIGEVGLAQNLVPNGGFESVRGKLSALDQIGRAEGWSPVTLGSADLFARDAGHPDVGVPGNLYGSLEPVEGDRYAGLFAWKDDGRFNAYEEGRQDPFAPGWNVYAEYIRIELTRPLVEGEQVRVRFKAALAPMSDRAVSGLGAYCSPVALHGDHRRFLQEKAQVASSVILDQWGVWVEVSGTFEADGGERHLVIGTFPYVGFEAARVVEGPDNKFAYYYIDAVSVEAVIN